MILNIVRFIHAGVQSGPDSEIVWGVLLALICGLVLILAKLKKLRQVIAPLTLVLAYLTLTEWAASNDTGDELLVKTSKVILISLVIRMGMIMAYDWLLFLGITLVMSLYNIARMGAQFGETDILSCLLILILSLAITWIMVM